MSLVSIRNNYLIDTPWRSSSFTDFAIDGHPHIWRVNISGNLAHLDDLSTIINAGEKARAKRYLQAPRQKQVHHQPRRASGSFWQGI